MLLFSSQDPKAISLSQPVYFRTLALRRIRLFIGTHSNVSHRWNDLFFNLRNHFLYLFKPVIFGLRKYRSKIGLWF